MIDVKSMDAPRERLLELHARWPERYPALFESAARSEKLGRYDILFAFPQRTVTQAAGRSFLRAFDLEFLEERRETIDCALPFTGGWLVFLGYEIASEIEPRLKLPRSPDPIVALAMRVPAALIYEHDSEALYLVVEPTHSGRIDELRRDLHDVASVTSRSIVDCSVYEEAPERFLDGVSRVKEYIAAGDVYQVNLSRGWTVQLGRPADPADLYRSLRRSNPAPFAATLVVGDWALLSSSPERLFCVRHESCGERARAAGREISTRPIAGTRPRSRISGADATEMAWLAAHPKERAEHVMLVDLERNDLGRICVPGSMRVDEFMVLESYEHVHHLVSNVCGRLLDGVTPAGVLRAVFPGGTITGCPKVRCMEIIAELEGVGRGAYTGSLGYLNRDGSGDFNILIRSMTYRRSSGEVRLRAGAGIVADSDPERELEETRAKAKGLLRALGDLG